MTTLFRLEELLRETLREAHEQNSPKIKVAKNTQPLSVDLGDEKIEFFATVNTRPDGSGDMHVFFKKFRNV